MAGPTGGGIGIGLVNVPESFAKTPNAAEWILERLTPSKTTTREFQVLNSTDKPMFVLIYPGAATNFDGNFVGASKGVVNELTSWTTVTPKSAMIPPHQGIHGVIKITVPSDAAPSMQFGLIWAQTTIGTTGGVTHINRVGIRMYDPVGDFIVPVSNTTTTKGPTSTTEGTAVANEDASSTGFVVTQGDLNGFAGIPAGLEWAAVGFLAAVVIGLLYKKIGRKDNFSNKE